MNTKTSRNIATGAAASLAAIVVLMMVPTTDTAPQGPAFYGMAEVVQTGPDGEVKSSQSVHNRIVDQGEELMFDALFDTGDPFVGKFGVICLSDSDSFNPTRITAATGEELTHLNSELDDGASDLANSDNPCKAVDTVTKHGNGSATIGTTFLAGAGADLSNATDFGTPHFDAVWICHAEVSTGAVRYCSSLGDGILAAVALPASQTVVGGDSYRVTYTLDLSSDDS
ncbi:hypothetical protein CENSYa_1100 [Cenarchaeum symbiosum A]|uniref:Uncharacterized protein n=1 Tax=Cenarchaeum symbiosum (strain A) TaxID=414004 RepID=A0RWL2_CENSY|nr:hypothetical protein CENSYa_1100 [Cenarchaeum symbiosum A]